MKQLSNVRKADKAHGDDLSLTRWVKEPGRRSKPSRTGLAPADASRTRFPTRVLRVADMTNLLVSGRSTMSTVSIKTEADCPPNAFVCPEQTNKTRCCATCGACWSTTKNVAFLEH